MTYFLEKRILIDIVIYAGFVDPMNYIKTYLAVIHA